MVLCTMLGCMWLSTTAICLFKCSFQTHQEHRNKCVFLQCGNLHLKVDFKPCHKYFFFSKKDCLVSLFSFFLPWNLSWCRAEVLSTLKVAWILSPLITKEGDERSREICSPCIVCLKSPSRKNVGTQRKSILTQLHCFVTFPEWCWRSLTFDLPYTLFEWSQTPMSVEFHSLGCWSHPTYVTGLLCSKSWVKRVLQADVCYVFCMYVVIMNNKHFSGVILWGLRQTCVKEWCSSCLSYIFSKYHFKENQLIK